MQTAILAATIAAVIAIIVAVVLIVLLKKKVITADTVENTSELLETIAIPGNGFASKLYEYVVIAVHAVEQLANTGIIENIGTAKKTAAIQYTEQIAKADEIILSDEELAVADLMIEAAVADLPRNQKEHCE